MKRIFIIVIAVMCLAACMIPCVFAAEASEPITTEPITTEPTDAPSDTTDDYASGVLGWFQRVWDGITALPSQIKDGFLGVLVPTVSPIFEALSDIRTRLSNFFDVTSIGITAIKSLRLVILQVFQAVAIMPVELQTFAMFSVSLMVGLAVFKLLG